MRNEKTRKCLQRLSRQLVGELTQPIATEWFILEQHNNTKHDETHTRNTQRTKNNSEIEDDDVES